MTQVRLSQEYVFHLEGVCCLQEIKERVEPCLFLPSHSTDGEHTVTAMSCHLGVLLL